MVGHNYSEYITNVQETNRFYPTIGNHDSEDYGSLDEYRGFFPLEIYNDEEPEGISSGGTYQDEDVYSFVAGNEQTKVEFFMMDWHVYADNLWWSNQKDWIEDELTGSVTDWQVVVGHVAPYSSVAPVTNGHGGVTELQWPFQAWGADAVFSGHNHVYERINGLEIRGQSSLNPATFGTQPTDISSRPTTAAHVPWEPEAWVVNAIYGSPDLSPVIQEIVNQGEWDKSDKSLVLVVEGTGTRTAHSYDGDPNKAPSLQVTYQFGSLSPVTVQARVAASSDDAEEHGPNAGTSPGQMYLDSTDLELVADGQSRGDQVVGIRFTNVDIPANAQILEAQLTFTADEASQRTTPFFTEGAGGAESDQFADVANVDAGSQVRAAGQAGAMLVSANDSFMSFEQWAIATPALSHLTDRVARSTDDAEQRTSGAVVTTSGDLGMFEDSDSGAQVTNSHVGVRFDDVHIPHGATIYDAYIQFTGFGAAEPAPVQIRAVSPGNLNDLGEFAATSNDIGNRALANGQVTWTPSNWAEGAGADQKTPNLAALVQGVVDHQNWGNGADDLVFRLEGVDGSATAVAWGTTSTAPTGVPELHVSYWDPSQTAEPLPALVDLYTVHRDGETSSDRLYLSAARPETGSELYVYNPISGTYGLAKDLVPGPTGSSPDDIVALDGDLFFTAQSPGYGRELWRLDAETGEATINDLLTYPGRGSEPWSLIAFDGDLFFSATMDVPESGWERVMMRLDPGSDGTSVVRYNDRYLLGPGDFTPFDGDNDGDVDLCFSARSSTTVDNIVVPGPSELFLYDAATETVSRLATGNQGPVTGFGLTPFNGKLYMGFGTAETGSELGRYDPETRQIEVVFDSIAGPTAGGVASNMVGIGNYLYFNGYSQGEGRELFRYDPEKESITESGSLVENLLGAASSYPLHLIALDDKLYFTARTIDGYALHRYDPSAELVSGQTIVPVVYSGLGALADDLYDIVAFDHDLYFAVLRPSGESYDVFRVDPTDPGSSTSGWVTQDINVSGLEMIDLFA
jgi:ELWxxDGT repeat protein